MDPSQGHFQYSISAPISNSAPHRPTLVSEIPGSSRTNEFPAEGPYAGRQDQLALLLPATVPRTVLTESPVNMTTLSQPLCRAGPSKHRTTASMHCRPPSSLAQHPWILAAEPRMHAGTSTQPHEAAQFTSASLCPSPKTNSPTWRQQVPAPQGPPPLPTQQSYSTFDASMSSLASQYLQVGMPDSTIYLQGNLHDVVGLPVSTQPIVASNPTDIGPAMQSHSGSTSLSNTSGSLSVLLATTSSSMKPTLAQGAEDLATMSKSLDDMLARTCEAPPLAACTSALSISTAEQHLMSYKRSLAEAHPDRLGGLLGLDHPLPTAIELEASSQLRSDPTKLQTRAAATSLILDRLKEVEIERLLALPRRASSGAVFVIDGNDSIIRSSDCPRIYKDCLSDDTEGIGLSSFAEHFPSPIRFSDLLAEAETVRWWQKISRKILLAHHQRKEIPPQANDQSGAPESMMRCKEEMVLKWKSKVGRIDLVDVKVSTVSQGLDQNQACLIVQVKLISIPTLATAATQPFLPSLHTRTHVITNRPGPCRTHSTAGTGAELRLLVSRYGLILRASCPTQMPSISNPLLPQHILGDGIAMPRHGQSLVDIPRLTPLLHVVAQAAIVGLAQTVKLNVSGKQITAVVQPVLRTSNSESEPAGRLRLTAAKVWISLSAVKEVARRSGSTSVTPTVGFANSFPEFIGLTPAEMCPSRLLLSDRRHSVQVPPRATQILPDRRASTASLYAYAALHQASISAQSSSSFWNIFAVDYNASSMLRSPNQAGSVEVEDHLSQLVANLEQENRMLRKEIDARLQRRLAQVPSRSQAPSTSEDSSFSADPYSSLRSGRTPRTCPSNLMHLS